MRFAKQLNSIRITVNQRRDCRRRYHIQLGRLWVTKSVDQIVTSVVVVAGWGRKPRDVRPNNNDNSSGNPLCLSYASESASAAQTAWFHFSATNLTSALGSGGGGNHFGTHCCVADCHLPGWIEGERERFAAPFTKRRTKRYGDTIRQRWVSSCPWSDPPINLWASALNAKATRTKQISSPWEEEAEWKNRKWICLALYMKVAFSFSLLLWSCLVAEGSLKFNRATTMALRRIWALPCCSYCSYLNLISFGNQR